MALMQHDLEFRSIRAHEWQGGGGFPDIVFAGDKQA